MSLQQEARQARLPEEWGGSVPTKVFLTEARRIVEEAEREGLTLRVMGGVAIRLHCLDHLDLATRLGRLATGQSLDGIPAPSVRDQKTPHSGAAIRDVPQEFTDLDFMTYERLRKRVQPFFAALGYTKRRATLSTAASGRQIYFHPDGWFYVDVFFDQLRVANHPLDLRRRLELDRPTLPLEDLLLEKLQIVHISEKDVKDALLLLAAHDLREERAAEALSVQDIARRLARDWGFWYTVTTNLRGIKSVADTLPDLNSDERRDVFSKIDALLARIEAEPKSARWKARAVIGPRLRWYEQVETDETVGDFGIWRLAEVQRRDTSAGR